MIITTLLAYAILVYAWSKTTQATSISPWVVPLAALKPFVCNPPPQDPAPLPYLKDPVRSTYDIQLQALLQPAGATHRHVVTTSNFKHLYVLRVCVMQEHVVQEE